MPVSVQKQEETGVPAHASAGRCPHLGAQYNPFTGPHAEDPHAFFEKLRKDEPVSFSPMLNMWLVSRYEDISQVLKSPAQYSNRDMLASGTHLTDEAKAILDQGFPTAHVLLGMDPPEHTRLRRLMNRGFTAQRIAGMGPFIREMATTLVDRFAQDGEADLVKQLAWPLPVHVILGVMGVPQEDVWKIKRWSSDWQQLVFEYVAPELQVEMAKGVIEFQQYCIRLIEDRKKNPQEDLTSYLVAVESDGEALTMHELVMAVGASMLSAGHESTTALMANAWKLALQHGLWQRLRDNRDLVPKFLEESSRYDSVSHAMIRTAKEDVELGGVKIPQGSRLLLLFAAGSRDESLCPHSSKLDVDREKVPQHLTYGRGTHFCLGAPLARLQFEITTNILLDRLPDPKLVPGQDFGTWQSLVLRQMKHLKVEWTPT
ncbi:cytochrome P450 family protein [Myxococcus xanthus DK 1622]|uniref:Cytochrome P450 family protein n=1 Tax=Myxococcus xanthus (strain DK1622) TaxID=246197 RepID=Q1CW12_MYXXD|nr:cytochrome P450 [Myxococcus xanthus]ABF90377.1 cytochrome P450 family protein [Myxococcus xanthus DK 1622]NOJ51748.1 cytochrome P450 [Myxococcus xanthus]QPM79548.1 cytochrome P450 [Myxococcus xanthus]QVW68628.1 cytochrome P450 [Myxococcus xanthus DZ2]QZZ54899.1 Cytochrome P450 116 [Myxococcus xanthus]